MASADSAVAEDTTTRGMFGAVAGLLYGLGGLDVGYHVYQHVTSKGWTRAALPTNILLGLVWPLTSFAWLLRFLFCPPNPEMSPSELETQLESRRPGVANAPFPAQPGRQQHRPRTGA